jgi:hypothetical protein
MENKGANPAARAEGERKEMNGQGAERSRAAEAPGQERKATQQGQAETPKANQQGQMEPKGAEGQKHTAQPGNAQSPAARTGANEPEKNAPKTGANEPEKNAPKTGANERDKNAPRTGANEQDKNAPRTGAAEQDKNAPRTGANERDRNNTRTGANERGQPRVQGNIRMSQEHATRVSQTLIREGHRAHVGIDIRVGVRVPTSVEVRPLPPDIIAIVPEYRGYDYFIDENDEIVFVAPQTHEVVGMIDYEGRAASEETTSTSVRGARPCPVE